MESPARISSRLFRKEVYPCLALIKQLLLLLIPGLNAVSIKNRLSPIRAC